MARHRAFSATVNDDPFTFEEEDVNDITADDISFDENEIFVDDEDTPTMAIPVIDEYEKGRSRMNLATDSEHTIWEAVEVSNIKPGQTVRAKNSAGTIIFGVVAPQTPPGYALNIGGVGVEADGWSFERVVPPVELPDEPGWYAPEDTTINLFNIFLLDEAEKWGVLAQDGSVRPVEGSYIAQTGPIVPLVRKSEIVNAIKERISESNVSDSAKEKLFTIVEGEH